MKHHNSKRSPFILLIMSIFEEFMLLTEVCCNQTNPHPSCLWVAMQNQYHTNLKFCNLRGKMLLFNKYYCGLPNMARYGYDMAISYPWHSSKVDLMYLVNRTRTLKRPHCSTLLVFFPLVNTHVTIYSIYTNNLVLYKWSNTCVSVQVRVCK